MGLIEGLPQHFMELLKTNPFDK